MINYPPLSAAPDEKETKFGLVYLALSLTVLPWLLGLVCGYLGMTAGQLNFIYYCINFAAAAVILRRFLKGNIRGALNHLFPTLYNAALGYLASQTLTNLLSAALFRLFPNFFNVNDQSIYTMLLENPGLVVIGVVVLVPLAEECFYRGLVFRRLYDRSPVLAYLISICAFAAIHVAGYVGSYDAPLLLLCFLQYIPAGYCLCLCYRRSGNILCPILMHMIVNAVSIYSYVR